LPPIATGGSPTKATLAADERFVKILRTREPHRTRRRP
jgi:hypothetical protein